MHEFSTKENAGWPKAYVNFDPEALAGICRVGVIHARVINGLPDSAQAIGVDFNPSNATFRVVFASPEFDLVAPGDPVPCLGDVQIENLNGHYVIDERFADPIVRLQTEEGREELSAALTAYTSLQESEEVEPDARDALILILTKAVADSAVLVNHAKELLYEGSPRNGDADGSKAESEEEG